MPPPSPEHDEYMSLALLGNKIDNLTKLIEDYQEEQSKQEVRLRDAEMKVARLEERLNLWQAAQALYSTIAAAIAAYLGTR